MHVHVKYMDMIMIWGRSAEHRVQVEQMSSLLMLADVLMLADLMF